MNPCLQHALLVYDTDDAFAARAVGHLDAGIEADHSVLAVTTGEKRAILRDALGSRSARVAFVDSDEVYTRPEDVLAHYDSTLRSLLRHGAPGITVYGELPVRETPEEWDAWISYEAILNRSFADRPASVVCGYDARAVPGEVLVKVYEAHPYVFTDKHRECPVYREPEEIVRDLAPAALPLPPMRTVPFADDREFKERLAFELAVARVPRNRAREMLVAAVEVLSNANYHGNGARMLRVGHDEDRFVCEVSDDGEGLDDRLAGYVPPRPGELDAAGLWVARQLTSRLEFVRSHDGHSVRLWL